MMEKQEFDIIFFDLPGTLNNKGAVNTIAHMDYVFCPIVADRVVMQSSLTYAKLVNDNMVTTGQTNIKGFYFVWNMVDAREKTRLYDIYNKVINELGLTALNTEVPDSKRFRREGDTEDKRPLFRSTMFPSDRTLIKGSCIRELTDEILDIIKL
jgi:cellulose biosynthesis protein BcsQ